MVVAAPGLAMGRPSLAGGRLRCRTRPAEGVEPEFIMIFAFKPSKQPGAWTLPDDAFRRLMDGSWNHELVLGSQTPSLLSERLVPVNPLVRVFARKDRLEGSVAEG